MSNIEFTVPELTSIGAWVDYRKTFQGGFGWRGDRSLDSVKHLVIHHTVSSATNDAFTDVSKVAREHIENRKWGGIGYNIIVTSEEVNGYAKAAYIGDLASIRAHTPNSKGALGLEKNKGNVYLLAVAIVGKFSNSKPSDAQLRTVHEICNELIYQDGRFKQLKNWDNLKAHRDFDSTNCPGDFDKYRNLIINPPKLNTSKPGSYEYVLNEAIKWNAAVENKYGIEIMKQVDKSQVTREELLIMLHRYTEYLRKSPYV